MIIYIVYYILTDDVKTESDDSSDEFCSLEDENSDAEMKSVIDDEMETMSVTSTATEAPMEPDKYDLRFDVNEEEKILSKIKGAKKYNKNYKIKSLSIDIMYYW